MSTKHNVLFNNEQLNVLVDTFGKGVSHTELYNLLHSTDQTTAMNTLRTRLAQQIVLDFIRSRVPS